MIDIKRDKNTFDFIIKDDKIVETNILQDAYIRFFSDPTWWAAHMFVGKVDKWLNLKLGITVTEQMKIEYAEKINSLYPDEDIYLEWVDDNFIIRIK